MEFPRQDALRTHPEGLPFVKSKATKYMKVSRSF